MTLCASPIARMRDALEYWRSPEGGRKAGVRDGGGQLRRLTRIPLSPKGTSSGAPPRGLPSGRVASGLQVCGAWGYCVARREAAGRSPGQRWPIATTDPDSTATQGDFLRGAPQGDFLRGASGLRVCGAWGYCVARREAAGRNPGRKRISPMVRPIPDCATLPPKGTSFGAHYIRATAP